MPRSASMSPSGMNESRSTEEHSKSAASPSSVHRTSSPLMPSIPRLSPPIRSVGVHPSGPCSSTQAAPVPLSAAAAAPTTNPAPIATVEAKAPSSSAPEAVCVTDVQVLDSTSRVYVKTRPSPKLAEAAPIWAVSPSKAIDPPNPVCAAASNGMSIVLSSHWPSVKPYVITEPIPTMLPGEPISATSPSIFRSVPNAACAFMSGA